MKARKATGKLTRLNVGDHVSWNSEAGRVSGTIIKVHTSDFAFKGYTHHASRDDPQYEIKSDKTEHIAAHKGSALRRTRGCGSKASSAVSVRRPCARNCLHHPEEDASSWGPSLY